MLRCRGGEHLFLSRLRLHRTHHLQLLLLVNEKLLIVLLLELMLLRELLLHGGLRCDGSSLRGLRGTAGKCERRRRGNRLTKQCSSINGSLKYAPFHGNQVHSNALQRINDNRCGEKLRQHLRRPFIGIKQYV